MRKAVFKIRAKTLAAYVYKRRALNSFDFSAQAAARGSRLHRNYQSDFKAEFAAAKLSGSDFAECEYAVTAIAKLPSMTAESSKEKKERQSGKDDPKIEKSEILLEISGRIDALKYIDGQLELIELKTLDDEEYDVITSSGRAEDRAQLKIYAALLLSSKPELRPQGDQTVSLNLSYLIGKKKKPYEMLEEMTFSELESFLAETLESFSALYGDILQRMQNFYLQAGAAAFPYALPRPGQADMMRACLRTIKNKDAIMMQAPTGIGKTLAVLYPAAKALYASYASQIIYLTAMEAGKTAAASGVDLLARSGMQMLSAVISAKEKICLAKDIFCEPAICPYASNYYNNLAAGLNEAAAAGNVDFKKFRLIGEKFKLCPYMLSLDYAGLAHCLICDYNHVFDPTAALESFKKASLPLRFKGFYEPEEKFAAELDRLEDYRALNPAIAAEIKPGVDLPRYPALLIDEAHNLPQRAKSMFSASLKSQFIIELITLLVYKFGNPYDQGQSNEGLELIFALMKVLHRLRSQIDFLASLVDYEAYQEEMLAEAAAASNIEEDIMSGIISAEAVLRDNFIDHEADFKDFSEKARYIAEDSRIFPAESRFEDYSAAQNFLAVKAPPAAIYETAGRALQLMSILIKENFHELLEHNCKNLFNRVYFDLNFFRRVYEDYFDEAYVSVSRMQDDAGEIYLLALDVSKMLSEVFIDKMPAVFFSATLEPAAYYSSLIFSKKLDFEPQVLKLPSPFPPENREVIALKDISMRYKEREASIASIYRLIKEICRIKTGNYLIFLPSYAYLAAFKNYLKFVDRPEDIDMMFQVPRMSRKLKDYYIKRFSQYGEKSLAAFAVLGSSFSEGIDLPGEKLSGVIIAGLGNPPPTPERNLSAEYFEAKYGNGFAYAFSSPGFNKIAQAAGRLIRDSEDKGFILLVDSRWQREDYLRRAEEAFGQINLLDSGELPEFIVSFWQRFE